MSSVSKNALLLIISVIISGGTFYALGRGPITGLQEEISQIGSENLVLQSQVEQLTDANNELLDKLEDIREDLSVTRSAFQNLQNSFTQMVGELGSIQSDFQDLLTGFMEAEAYRCMMRDDYTLVWERYAELLIAYNNLTSGVPIGRMIATETSGIINGDWEDGNEGWFTQGVSNLVGGVKYLHQHEQVTFTTQSVTLSNRDQGLQCFVKPQPQMDEINLEISVGGVILFAEHYSGPNKDWEKIIIPFRPLMQMREQYGFPIEGVYDIRFTVPAGDDTGANIALDNVSLVEIEYVPEL